MKRMKPFLVSPAKDVTVRFSNDAVRLPEHIQAMIDMHWEALMASGKRYTRGEVFTVTEKVVEGNAMHLVVERTDYAHYLYCQHEESLGDHGVHIIHTAALVETADGYYVLGEMGPETARHGIVQLCGGGIDYDDLTGEYFDLRHNMTKELQEELGIDVLDTARVAHFGEAYVKEGGPTDKMTAIFRVVLKETSESFLNTYDAFVTRLRDGGQEPEFGKLIMLKKDAHEIEAFFAREGLVCDEYMRPLFEALVGELQ